jgi:hypothetical protein
MFMLFLQVPYWDILLGGMAEIDMASMADEMARFVTGGITSRPEKLSMQPAEGAAGLGKGCPALVVSSTAVRR